MAKVVYLIENQDKKNGNLTGTYVGIDKEGLMCHDYDYEQALKFVDRDSAASFMKWAGLDDDRSPNFDSDNICFVVTEHMECD